MLTLKCLRSQSSALGELSKKVSTVRLALLDFAIIFFSCNCHCRHISSWGQFRFLIQLLPLSVHPSCAGHCGTSLHVIFRWRCAHRCLPMQVNSRVSISLYAHKYICFYIDVCMYVYACVCVCVCIRSGYLWLARAYPPVRATCFYAPPQLLQAQIATSLRVCCGL